MYDAVKTSKLEALSQDSTEDKTLYRNQEM